jgi:hypothetical protein
MPHGIGGRGADRVGRVHEASRRPSYGLHNVRHAVRASRRQRRGPDPIRDPDGFDLGELGHPKHCARNSLAVEAVFRVEVGR